MNKKRYARLQIAGKCGICCVAPNDEGYKTCAKCRERARKTRASARERWQEKGLCADCGKQKPDGQRKCDDCTKKSKDFYSLRPRKKAKGGCVACGFEYPDTHHIDGNHENGFDMHQRFGSSERLLLSYHYYNFDCNSIFFCRPFYFP